MWGLVLCRQVDERAASLKPATSAASHQQALETLEHHKFLAAKECNDTEQSLRGMTAEMKKLDAEIAALEDKVKAVDADVQIECPKTRFDMPVLHPRIQWQCLRPRNSCIIYRHP